MENAIPFNHGQREFLLKLIKYLDVEAGSGGWDDFHELFGSSVVDIVFHNNCHTVNLSTPEYYIKLVKYEFDKKDIKLLNRLYRKYKDLV